GRLVYIIYLIGHSVRHSTLHLESRSVALLLRGRLYPSGNHSLHVIAGIGAELGDCLHPLVDTLEELLLGAEAGEPCDAPQRSSCACGGAKFGRGAGFVACLQLEKAQIVMRDLAKEIVRVLLQCLLKGVFRFLRLAELHIRVTEIDERQVTM